MDIIEKNESKSIICFKKIQLVRFNIRNVSYHQFGISRSDDEAVFKDNIIFLLECNCEFMSNCLGANFIDVVDHPGCCYHEEWMTGNWRTDKSTAEMCFAIYMKEFQKFITDHDCYVNGFQVPNVLEFIQRNSDNCERMDQREKNVIFKMVAIALDVRRD
jgi:hypothetical protein